MARIRHLIVIIVVAGLGLLAAMAWLQLKPGDEKKENTPATMAADLQLQRVKYTETREGVKEWELEALSVGYFQEEGTIICEKVKATFYGPNKVYYTLIGEKGKFNTKSKIIEVFAGVNVDSSNGYHLRTESLKYLADKKELVTDDFVEMQGPQFLVKGQGLVVDLEQQRVRILNQVSTTFADIDKRREKIGL